MRTLRWLRDGLRRSPWAWVWFAAATYVIAANARDARRYEADITLLCDSLWTTYLSLPESLSVALSERDYQGSIYTACEEPWWIDPQDDPDEGR